MASPAARLLWWPVRLVGGERRIHLALPQVGQHQVCVCNALAMQLVPAQPANDDDQRHYSHDIQGTIRAGILWRVGGYLPGRINRQDNNIDDKGQTKVTLVQVCFADALTAALAGLCFLVCRRSEWLLE